MIGHIYLVRNEKLKIVPAVVIAVFGDQYTMAQIRRSKIEDYEELAYNMENRFDNMVKSKLEGPKKSKPVKKVMYIGQLEGLLSPSTIMLSRTFLVTKGHMIKEISRLEKQQIVECTDQFQKIQRSNKLHTRMKQLKKRIQLAQINNERYEHHEKELDVVLAEIGYATIHRKKEERGYLNYREVPTNGYIKIYRGGRS